jgi:plastocyanin
MKRKTVAVLKAPKRMVVLLTVWAMALTGALATVAVLPGSASAAVPTARSGLGSVVARDAAGLLWLYPVNGAGVFQTRRQIGSGWNVMTALVTPGDVTGDGNTDVLARDTSGRLWIYPGTRTGALSSRRQIGSGWQGFTLTSAGDMNRAGRPDLLARDSAGVLWLYPLSGNAVFGRRVKVGTGWNGFTLVGPGDVSGDRKADILARDRTGTMWLYRGNGLGGVVRGSRVSGGWQGMTALVGPGNWDRLLGNDMLARDTGGRLWLYPGNNAGGFGRARQVSSGWAAMTYLGWSSSTTLAPPDVAPGPVTGLAATVLNDTSIKLAWTNPGDADFTGVTIRRAPGATAPATATSGTSVPVPASATATSYTDTTLTPKTQYSYAVFAHDGSLNHAAAVKVSATTLDSVDVTPPGPVTGLAATVTDTSIKLAWTNPGDADFTGVTIRRALGDTAPATATSGTSVTGGVATATSYIDTGLTVGQQYSYAVFAHDGSGNNAAATTVTAATTTSSRPTAVLSVNSSHGLTAKTSVGGYTALFDVTASLAGSGSTLVSAVLDYGDGTPVERFSGEPATWFTVHGYATVGGKTVTVVVTNSAGATATDSVAVSVYPLPTATIKVVGPVVPGQPVTFELTSSTSAGTVFTDYDFCFDGTAGPVWVRQSGLPPTSTTYTFTAEGMYDAEFYAYNDADGWVLASVAVRVDATAPGPVTALSATAAADSVALNWVNPTDADFAGVTIRRLAGATAPTLTTGTLVIDTIKAATSFTDTGLNVGTQYSYAAFAHDGSGNVAAAAKATDTTLARPTAGLSINGSSAATATTSVGGYKPFFDVSGSQAGSGTLVSALLDYGDGTTQSFTGADPATWSSEHVYATSGDKSVTVLVTNSAGDTATAAVLVTVFGAPTASILPPRIARPGDPVTLALTSSTPSGTAFTDYEMSYDNGLTWEYPSGVPPTTLTHTFSAEGTYTVMFNVYNDADGWALSSAQVRVDITPPAPATSPVVSVVSVGDTWLSLSWVNPADADFTGVMIRRLAGATAPATVTGGDLVSDFNDGADYVINPGLIAGTQYSYAVFAHDGSGNFATGVTMTGSTSGTAPHGVPPGPVTTLTAAAVSDSSIKLDWVNPTDADFAGVTIRRAQGLTAPASAVTGDAVTVPASATATSFTDTGLTAGTQYSYAVFSYDVANNHAAAVNVTKTTTMNTTAVLRVDTTRITTGAEFFCDPAASYAATGATLTAGSLDYGDGTAPEAFTGDPAGWFAFHTYAAPGAQTMTWKVTDSANKSVTTVVTMNVFDPPTAAIPATGQAQVGVPFTFPLTATTPVGTAFEGWSLYGDWMTGGFGTAIPATLTHTFTEAGEYSFVFKVTNDAQGLVESSPMVVTVVP